MTSRLLSAYAVLCASFSPAFAAFPTIRLQPISQQEIVAPVGITHAGDGSQRLFVTDQRGTIHVIQNDSVLPTPFLDIGTKLVSERPGFDERGLLGLTFHPNFGQSGAPGEDKFYVYYSAPRPGGNPDDPVNPINHQSIVAEYSVDSLGANTASPSSERILLSFDEPQFNHNAGYVGFGPDGMLYVTTGDGGGGGDNEPGHTGGGAGNPTGGLGNSQDLTRLLGKVLRIDVHGNNGPGGQYGIPSDNPLVGSGGGVREEIFAYGLRNPWRAAFDDGPGGTGRFFVADVGQGDVEEINLIEPRGNYGWRIKEGQFEFDNTVAPNPPVPDPPGLIDPIAQYLHPNTDTSQLPGSEGLLKVGLSVTGGVVYRGNDFPSLQGKYLFGDWSREFSSANGTLLGLEETTPGEFDLSVLNVEGGNPIGRFIQAFGLDERGEAYVATRTTLAPSARDSNGLPTGAIFRIVVVPEPASWMLLITAWLVGRRPRTVVRPGGC
jgi:glucose/arabinose dehydrogenase